MTTLLFALILGFQKPSFNFSEHVTPPAETVGSTWNISETLTSYSLLNDKEVSMKKKDVQYTLEILKTSDTKEPLQVRRDYTLGKGIMDKRKIDLKLSGKSVDFKKADNNTWSSECYTIKNGKRKNAKIPAIYIESFKSEIEAPQGAYQLVSQILSEQPLVLHTPLSANPELVSKLINPDANDEPNTPYDYKMTLEEITDTSFTLSFKGTHSSEEWVQSSQRNVTTSETIELRLVLAKGPYRELERHKELQSTIIGTEKNQEMKVTLKDSYTTRCQPAAQTAQIAPKL